MRRGFFVALLLLAAVLRAYNTNSSLNSIAIAAEAEWQTEAFEKSTPLDSDPSAPVLLSSHMEIPSPDGIAYLALFDSIPILAAQDHASLLTRSPPHA